MANHPPSNRLAKAVSPYLLQHAHNPVDWHPWGEEALARARDLDRPIFLSVGYAACHWCHVMEEESFNDPAVARIINDSFVPIKVDREERPDIDAVYMAAVQAMTGGGGWPLNVFLTPDLRPFFGGTYFPPERRWGKASFPEILNAVTAAWRDRRGEVAESAGRMTAQLASWGAADRRKAVAVRELRRNALGAIARNFDSRHGGFTPAPKFPSPSRLFFLLRLAQGGDSRALEMLTVTLDGMAAGGMYDWVGGGFHRYSVDAAWLIPHFEKMLYDNALLARVFGAAGILLDTPRWVTVARETADYLIREMQGPEGGFFSSTDADSEGKEGLFFTWTPAEIRAALPADRAELVIRLCRVTEEGNFEGGRSALRPTIPVEELAAETGLSTRELAQALAVSRDALLTRRSGRVPPALDDKRLAGWNGMAIWALAYLGAALDEPRYLDAARRAGLFLADTLLAGNGILRAWRDGRTSGVETLEDVAWVSAGLTELFQADGNPRWLRAVLRLVDTRLPRYQGPMGELFDTPDDGEPLPVRPREAADGATPAPAGVMAQTLVRLAHLAGPGGLRDNAAAAIEAEGTLVNRAPEACSALLDAGELLELQPLEIVVVGSPGDPAARRLLAAAYRAPQPPAALVPPAGVPVSAALAELVPLLRGREQPPTGKPAVFVCHGGVCGLPADDEETLLKQLSDL